LTVFYADLCILIFFLIEKIFLLVNIFRIVAAGLILISPQPFLLAALLAIHLLTISRWLGSYNGGSDYMNSILLLFVTLGLAWPGAMGKLALWYIAFQSCLSYFKAGTYKLAKASWHSGRAVDGFLNSPVYEQTALIHWLTRSHVFNKISAWFIIIFEMSFPLAVLDHRLALIYLTLGLVFHAMNAYVFGLNRFLWAWAATYPAIYYCSLHRI
jgi:hypothetical protein